MPETRPNILWICTDQQRFDTIAALGHRGVRTPHLDRLAASGTAFERAYCQNPICTPSRASFLTGRYPHAVGVNTNGNGHFPRRAEETLVSRLLAEAGYDCGLVGKLHLASCANRPEPRVDDGYRYFKWSHSPRPLWDPADHDYARWLSERGHDPRKVLHLRDPRKDRAIVPTEAVDNVPPDRHHLTWMAERALGFLDEAREPWLLSINTFEPHPPFNPPWEYYRRFDPATLDPPWLGPHDLARQHRLEASGVDFQTSARDLSGRDGLELKAAYYAMVEFVDAQVGRILDRLEATGQREQTVVVFSSDHGEMLGDHGLVQKGCRFYEGLVRVPLIWSWPGQFRRGLRSPALVELIDIAPTLLEVAGVPVPARMQGRSLAGLLRGEASPDRHRPFVRSEYYDALGLAHGTRATMYCDGRWKLVQYHNAGTGELYDLSEDPREQRDLWDDEGCRPVRDRLSRASFDATVMALDEGAARAGDY